jgi:hypothetical protein
VAEVVWLMLEEINAFLEVARKTVDAWLGIPAARPPVAADAATDDFRRLLGEILLLTGPAPFQGQARVFNLPAFQYLKSGQQTRYPAYWVMDLQGTYGGNPIDRRQVLIFDYDPVRTTDKQWPQPRFTNRIALGRHDSLVALGLPTRKQYAVSYVDDNAGLLLYMPLYHPVGDRKGKPLRLGYADIQDSVVMGTAGPRGDKLFVTRPRVRATPAYLTFLKTIGAIA